MKPQSPYNLVYEIVSRIPSGKVLTYGAISRRMNARLSAAAVGWAMRALPSEASSKKGPVLFHARNVPWHRVINSRGGISTTNEPGIPDGLQRSLLESEGVEFDEDGTVELARYLWSG